MMNLISSRKITSKGFSLIEMIVFIVIVAIVIGGLAALYLNTLQKDVTAQKQLDSINLAREYVEQIVSNRQVSGFNCSNAAPTNPCPSPTGCTAKSASLSSKYTVFTTLTLTTAPGDATNNYCLVQAQTQDSSGNVINNLYNFLANY